MEQTSVDAHLHDLLDAALGGLRAAGDHQRAKLLAAVVRAPEADEGAIAKGKIDDIFRAHAKAPEAIAPHLGNPFPVLHAVQHADGRAPAGAGGQVIADGVSPGSVVGRSPNNGFSSCGCHPLLARHEGDAPQIIQRLKLVWFEASRVEALPVEWALA